MNLSEITVSLPKDHRIVWIVMDNQCYGTQRHWQRDHFGGLYGGTDLAACDFCEVARSMGVPSKRVRSSEEFLEAVEQSSACQRCCIVVEIDPEVKPPQAYGSTLVK